MAIPNTITAQHIIKAIKQAGKDGYPKNREATDYYLIYNDKTYPPKYIISIANTFVNGVELKATEFNGGEPTNKFLRNLGFIVIEEKLYPVHDNTEAKIKRFNLDMEQIYVRANKEAKYNASGFLGLIREHTGYNVAKRFINSTQVTSGFTKLFDAKRLDLTVEAHMLIPYYKEIFTLEERQAAFERLKEYHYEIQGIVFVDIEQEPEIFIFKVGQYYSRKDVYKVVNVPDAQQGGNWDTGYTRFINDSYVFANVGTAGRTGHDHPNKFYGNDLNWYGKKNSKLNHESIQAFIKPKGKTYIFVREDSNDTNFLFLGLGRAKEYFDISPVNIIWSFDDVLENHPELLPEEVSEPKKYSEGALKQIYVNVYERNPLARKKCIEHYGLECVVCKFNFENIYGEIGKDFIHVHHLKPLSEVGEEYEVNPILDLRPVCPNCHAMLHKRNPAYSIEELVSLCKN